MFYIKKCSAPEAGFWKPVCCGILPKPLNQSQGAVRGDTSTGGASELSRQRAEQRAAYSNREHSNV